LTKAIISFFHNKVKKTYIRVLFIIYSGPFVAENIFIPELLLSDFMRRRRRQAPFKRAPSST